MKKKRKIMENKAITKEGEFQSAKGALQAIEYKRVDDAFLEKFNNELNIVQDYLELVGGVFLFTVEDYDVICRLPSHEVFTDITNRSELSGFEQDRMLVGRCLIYPSMDIINEWVTKRGHWGIVSSIARKMMQEAKVAKEAKSKKLFLKPSRS